jgi:hypothetical protein
MSNEIATQNYGSVVNFEDYAMSTEAVVRQVNVIQAVMKSVMKVDEHYGTITGCKKPSLYKPGAEKLGFTFRLAPEYDVRTINMANGHREYQVKCRLRHIPTGAMVGEGEGSCTTMEGKYRYRGGEKEGTGQAIPKEYWNLKNAGKSDEALDLIGGPGFAPGKIDGKWEICSIGEKVEHDNPADYYNTCLKVAKKRAHVDAILTATAASDIFTQDVEDMSEVMPGAPTTQQTETQTTTAKPPMTPPQEKKGIKDPEAPASDAQIKAISTMWGKLGLEDSMKYAYCSETAGLTEVIKSTKDLTKAQASAVIERLNKDIEEKKATE